jgi:hypothetical protein
VKIDEGVRFAKRLGASDESSSSPRPLLVGFKAVTDCTAMLDKSPALSELDESWSVINIVRDLTKGQRKEEKDLRDEATKNNSELSEEDSLNWIWKVVGRRGERKLVRVKKNFVNAVQDNFLSQLIDFPTHVSGTQPDVILSSHQELVVDVADRPALGKSDHSMIMLTVAGSLPTNTTFEMVKDWRKADIPLLREEVSKVNWVSRLQNMNTLSTWDCIKETIQKAEDTCVPLKRRRISARPLWMQQNVMRIIRKKRRLWETYRKSKDYEEYQAYQKVQKEARMMVRQAKRKFEKKLAKEAKRKPKLFYSYLKTRSSNKQSVGPLQSDGKMVSDNIGMSDALNRFFVSVFTVENPAIPEPTNMDGPDQLTDVDFPSSGVEEKLKLLNPGSANGPDKITGRTLKELVDILCVPLSIVFRRSMDEGVVPEDWRKANITPIKEAPKCHLGTIDLFRLHVSSVK